MSLVSLLAVAGPASLPSRASALAGSSRALHAIVNQPLASGVHPVVAASASSASLIITATGPDGTNSGKAGLGHWVNLTTTLRNSPSTARVWTLQGAGSIRAAGSGSPAATYTAPSAMPANSKVTISVHVSGHTNIADSYSFSLQNPLPTIVGGNVTSPSQLQAGITQTVSLTGLGFVPHTVVILNGAGLTTNVQSLYALSFRVPVPANASGTITFQLYSPGPGGGWGSIFHLGVHAGSTGGSGGGSGSISASAAARLLDQTTFGPTTSLIQHVQQQGINNWLNEQFYASPSVLAKIPTVWPWYCGDAEQCLESEWWQAVLTHQDQLRQRVALALSEMLVVSSNGVTGQAINAYANILSNDSFSNWRTIMQDVTLSPTMGIYLNMVGSYRPMGANIANENYARENMQLFNLGVNLLNQDGSLKRDSHGNTIPAYTQAQVKAFARVFTGWTYANQDGSTPSQFIGNPNYYHPMVAVEQWHDHDPKTLLNGTYLPAGRSASADLKSALDNVFNHPNTPPFVSRQLIQHLVTSTPSPAYVSRVAGVFQNNGSGVRGDMKAVIKAIVTDPEARAGDTNPGADDGHLREPVLWLSAVMRGLGYVNTDSNNYYQYASMFTGRMSQVVYQAPSVFNFYPPSYVIPGTGLNAPEFALENTASVIDKLSVADNLTQDQIVGFNVDLSPNSALGKLAANPPQLVDALGTLFLHSQMSDDMRSAIISDISGISDRAQRTRVATYLVITSSEYKVIH